MSQTVIIKSNKYGINLILDQDIPFEKLLDTIVEKFKESEKFFKNSKLGISFEGRKLTQEEENRIVDAITANTSIEILCVVDNDGENAEKMKKQVQAYREAIEELYERDIEKRYAQDAERQYVQDIEKQYAKDIGKQGEFYKGTLRSGQVLESEASIVILGDVNPGAKVVSGGNIVILGALKGNAHAGAYGSQECFIVALDMEPIQIQIGELIAKSPDKQKPKKRLIRKEKETNEELQIAIAREGAIYIEPVTRKILNGI